MIRRIQIMFRSDVCIFEKFMINRHRRFQYWIAHGSWRSKHRKNDEGRWLIDPDIEEVTDVDTPIRNEMTVSLMDWMSPNVDYIQLISGRPWEMTGSIDIEPYFKAKRTEIRYWWHRIICSLTRRTIIIITGIEVRIFCT